MSTEKTVLITGASSGIGYEFSNIFASRGYHLILVSMNAERLRKAADEIMNKHRVHVRTIEKDLSKINSAEEIYAEATALAGHIDILINNAGIQVYGPFGETKQEDEINLLAVNLISLTKLTKLFLKDMIKRGNGKILNVGSTGSFAPGPLNAVYCASKAYVLSLSEAIAQEIKGTGVTITTLCPGATKTDFARRAGIENVRLFKSKTMSAHDVAEIGYKALMKGRTTVVAGFYNKLVAFSVRITPRRIVSKISQYLMSI